MRFKEGERLLVNPSQVLQLDEIHPPQIVTVLRQIEVEIANGKTTPQACREAQITTQTYYRWRKEYGGLKLSQANARRELREFWAGRR